MYWLRPRHRRFPLWFIVILLLSLLPAGQPPVVAAQPPAPPSNAPAPPAITFTKTAEPGEVSPGDVITYTLTVTNRADVPLSGAVMSDPLPAGVTYVPGSASAGEYDPTTRTLTWALPDLAGGETAALTLQVRAEGGAPNPILNTAQLSHADWPRPLTAHASTHVPYTAEAAITPEQGGRLTAPGGRVTLDFPAGAVEQPVQVSYRSLDARRLAPTHTGLALQFELTARPADAAGAAPITRFQKPLRLTVDLTGLVDVESLGRYKKPFVGYRDETTGRWVHLPVVEQQFDRPVLTVEVDHFSSFGGGADGEVEWGWTLTFNEATVGSFDGGLGYSYPMQVVPGRAGLTPQLNLSYNSRRMDGVLSWVQSDWAGLGWTVDTVEILRKGVQRCWQDNWICYENEFVLVLNGTTYELEPATGADYGRYHTADESFLYIERRNAAGSNGSSQNTTSEYWIVRTKDGTQYRLGYTPNAEQVFGPYARSGGQPAFGYVGTHPSLAAFRWRVDQVTDAHDNHIDYTYYEETKAYQCANEPAWPSCQGVLDDNSERASYLDRIEYNHRPSNGQPGVRIIFQRAKRGSDVDDLTAPRAYGQSGLPLAVFWQRHYLQRIQVQAYDAPAGNWVTLREYRFTYGAFIPADESNKRLRVLTTVQAWAPQGTGWVSLPATTFSYQGYQNKAWCNCSGSEWNEARFYYPRLSQIDNGYGGVITAQYETPDDGYWHAHNYRVSHRETKDRGTTARQTDYTYPSLKVDRCYDNDDDRVCEFFDDGNQWDFSGGTLVGYKWSIATLKDGGGATVAITEHDFWLKTKSPSSPTFALGREIETRTKAPNGTILRTVKHAYVDDTTSRPAGVHFIYLQQTDVYAGDTAADHAKTDYSYDLTYGNLTRVIDYGSDAAGDERTTHYLYSPNNDPNVWIVDRAARESVYAGVHYNDDSVDVVARTRYRYDNQTCPWNVAPVKGDLTHLDRWNGGSGSPGDCYAAAFDTTVYGYDEGYAGDYGNLTSTTDPRGNTTTTAYDSTFYTFPIQETNAKGQTTSTQYYGVNGSSAAGTGAFFGQVESVTDPNNAVTQYRYDVFGRLTKLIRPGDSINYPSVQFTYTDSPPFRVQRDQREWSGNSGVITAYRFYDGLGRPIQTKQELPNNQQAVQHVTYNAQGLMAAEYIPYGVTPSSSYVPVDPTKPKTSYTYDALGRQRWLTHPDERTAETAYNGWQTAVIDEKDHQLIRATDAFGRLVTVKEYTGTYPSPNWGATPYATTSYAYNVLDLLTQVQDAAGNTTSISYDPLGRKTDMTDPDMGAWSYGYDAAGNLTRQTDARNQTLCFFYDELNRPKGKTYRTDTNCPADPGYGNYAVSYAYDNHLGDAGTAYSWGRRRVTWVGGWPNTSNKHEYRYDARGRLTEEKTIVDGVTYTFSYAYRADDQVYQVVYPDNEDVRTQYDAAGRPERLWNTGWPTDIFVDATTYNAQGQLKTLKYTNGLTTHFGYYGYNGFGIGDGDDAPNQSWANVHLGKLWKLCTVPSSESCPQAGNGNARHDLRYAYDAAGNVSSLRDKVNSNQVQSFVYDELSRLTQAYTDGVGQAQYNRSYTYNAIGNLINKAGTSQWYGGQSSSCPDGYLYKPHAVVTAGSDTFCYDRNGNMVKRNGTTYTLTYDAESRLTQVSGAATASFTYDADGRLVKRVAGQTTVYVGDRYQKNTSTGEVTKYYYFGSRRVAVRQAGTLYWLLVDHLGSSMVLVDGNGNKWKEQWYYPFGEQRYPTNDDISIDRRFTGQRWDATIELYDYRARYYDPALGRFTQPDPIVPEPGNPQALNRYAYVYNNPLRYTDRSGLFTEEELINWGIYTAEELKWLAEHQANWYNYLMQAALGDAFWFVRGSAAFGAGEFRLDISTLTIAGGAFVWSDKPGPPVEVGQGSVRRWGETIGQAAIHTWPLNPGERAVPGLSNPRVPLSGPAAEMNAGFVLGWDFGVALISTGGWFLVGLDTLVAPPDPAGKLFGYAVANIGSAAATVTLLDTLLTSGPNSHAMTVSATTYGLGWTSLIWAVPVDLAAAWGQVGYDYYTLQRIQRRNQR